MTEPSGAIHDIGYRHYTGERLPSRYAARALTVEGLRGAFGFGRSAKAKVMPLILLGLVTFAALLLGASAAIGNLDELEVRPAPFVPFVLLVGAGFEVGRTPKPLTVDVRLADGQAGDPTYDAVRDAAANLQVGLIRVQRQRHHLSEIFVRGEPR